MADDWAALVANRIQPAHFINLLQEPVGFLPGFALQVFMVGAGLMLMVAAIMKIKHGPH
jgi:hypothetical protein